MTFGEIVGFLLPQWSDPLQVIFLILMSLMMLLTIVSAHAIAKPKSWEEKWNRGTPDDHSDDLDIEHGSVTDLWHAVATWPEKLAEIMPGMLLVVGLLGTFLGLGLALNHASQILGSPGALSAGGAANSMHELLGMLQGLGTKFKTSTWGIAGFVALKIWSESTRFEEKRLTWVIGKVKTELEFRKKQAQQAEIAKQVALFTRIEDAAGKIVGGISEQLSKVMEQDKQLVISSIKHAQKQTEDVCKTLEVHREQAAQHHQQLYDYLAADALSRSELADRQLAATNDACDQIRDGQQQVTTLMLDQLEKSGQQVLAELQRGTAEQAQCHAALLGQFTVLHQDLQELQISADGTQQAMARFTDNTQAIVEKMGSAATDMASGASKVGDAASSLVGAINDFKSQFSEVLLQVKEGLGSAIVDMSTQASSTLASGSAQLAKATGEISTALGKLSDDVNNTMSQVKTSINDAQSIQAKTSAEFIVTSETLNTNIGAATSNIEKLAKPIENGLKGISDLAVRLNKSVADVMAVHEKIAPLQEINNSELKLLNEGIKSIPASQDYLASTLAPLQTVPNQLASIGKILDKIQAAEGTHLQLQQIIEQLSGINLASERKKLLEQLATQLSVLEGLKSVPDTLSQCAGSLESLQAFLTSKNEDQPAAQVSFAQAEATTA